MDFFHRIDPFRLIRLAVSSFFFLSECSILLSDLDWLDWVDLDWLGWFYLNWLDWIYRSRLTVWALFNMERLVNPNWLGRVNQALLQRHFNV